MKATLGQVLSVTTERLLCEIGDVYKVLNYMTGDTLFTHQLPLAARECAPWLLRWFPQLAEIDVSDVTTENWREFLNEHVAKFGNEFTLSQIPADDHIPKDPISEAIEMFGAENITVVRHD